jgi:CubicO group peptidase (beta-lactamase class C family)
MDYVAEAEANDEADSKIKFGRIINGLSNFVINDFLGTVLKLILPDSAAVADYEKFVYMLASEGKTREGNRILSEESLRLMATPAEPFDLSRGEKWGLAVRVITSNDNRLPKGSFGWSGAYGCHFWVDPQNKISAIYMKNSSYDGGSGALTAANLERDVYTGT